ncbi:hypothetical protein PVAP13_7NG257800 [Panicum virgatum]|uniref:Uncharacterized protein n=1 Tax=Panicum virgatum TaxID=38727 RepID=A0A8T0Q010_PANVG|nr:hypothetical protein PVAP13_7NG257800 [Panicum virgatum]
MCTNNRAWTRRTSQPRRPTSSRPRCGGRRDETGGRRVAREGGQRCGPASPSSPRPRARLRLRAPCPGAAALCPVAPWRRPTPRAPWVLPGRESCVHAPPPAASPAPPPDMARDVPPPAAALRPQADRPRPSPGARRAPARSCSPPTSGPASLGGRALGTPGSSFSELVRRIPGELWRVRTRGGGAADGREERRPTADGRRAREAAVWSVLNGGREVGKETDGRQAGAHARRRCGPCSKAGGR